MRPRVKMTRLTHAGRRATLASDLECELQSRLKNGRLAPGNLGAQCLQRGDRYRLPSPQQRWNIAVIALQPPTRLDELRM